VERCGTLLLPSVRTEYGCTILTTEVAHVLFEFVEGEEEIVKLSGGVTFFLALLHLLRPHGAVHVHKLVDLERNEAACDGTLAVQPTEKASQELLWVVDQLVFLHAEVDTRLSRHCVIVFHRNVCEVRSGVVTRRIRFN